MGNEGRDGEMEGGRKGVHREKNIDPKMSDPVEAKKQRQHFLFCLTLAWSTNLRRRRRRMKSGGKAGGGEEERKNDERRAAEEEGRKGKM